MKTPSDFLWRLIRSLNTSEKTFLKRNFVAAGQKENKIYLRLLTAIDQQKQYNETAILKKFAPAIHAKNIAFQKHYLQKIVTDALVQYDNRKTIGQEVYNKILLIRVLRKKGLLDGASTLWKKTVLTARQNELYPLLTLLVIEFEKMILTGSPETEYEDLHSVFKNRSISYDDYAVLNNLRDIYTEVLLLKRQAHFDITDDLKQRIIYLLDVVNHSDIKNNMGSFWLRHYFNLNKATLHYLLNDTERAMPFLQQALHDWHQHIHYIKKDGEFYIELLYMINYAGILHGDYDFVINSFNHPANLQLTDNLQSANFEALKFLAFNKIYNKTAQYDKVKKLNTNIKTKYLEWEPYLTHSLIRTINFSLGIAFLVLGNYEDALFFIKRGNNYFKDGTREEYTAISHILLLILTYSMDNDRLFEAEYRATYTYFNKRQNNHPSEIALIHCLKRCFYAKNKKDKQQEFKKALAVIEQHKNNSVQKLYLTIFNYRGWLQSRLENISYRTYVERQVHNNTIPENLSYV